jgi:hypothetical protein
MTHFTRPVGPIAPPSKIPTLKGAPSVPQRSYSSPQSFMQQSLIDAADATQRAHIKYVQAHQRLVRVGVEVPPSVVEKLNTLMVPGLQASLQRAQRERQADPMLAHRAAHRAQNGHRLVRASVHTLYERYNGASRHEIAVQNLFKTRPPPPRLASLVGGVDAWLALPELVSSPKDGRSVRLPQLQPQDLPAAVVRGICDTDRLFLAVGYRRETPAIAHGLVVLAEQPPQSGSGWMTYNPQHFMPPNRANARGPFAPLFPAMGSARQMAGGPDAQAMLTFLGALLRTGQCPGYTLAVPSPQQTPDGQQTPANPGRQRAPRL